MSSAVYPELAGLEYGVTRAPIFKTLTQETVSGDEVRAQLASYPRYRYSLKYEFLRSAAAYVEFQNLFGFFTLRHGKYDSFLLRDPDDYSVTAQGIGTGGSGVVAFQMLRTFGGFAEPILNVYGTSHIYLAGVEQMSGWSIGSTGVLTFTSAPGTGVAITATFTYYWRVRFLEDELEFEKFVDQVWKSGRVELLSCQR